MEHTHTAVGEKGNAPNDERKPGHVDDSASKNGIKIATQPSADGDDRGQAGKLPRHDAELGD